MQIIAMTVMMAVIMLHAIGTAVLPAAHDMSVKPNTDAVTTIASMDAPQMRSGGPCDTICSKD